MFKSYEDLIIRPPRSVTTEEQLGNAESDNGFVREELVITNKRNQRLFCSFVRPKVVPAGVQLPCLVYCHSNASNRARSLEFRDFLVHMNCLLFAFDFAGCGQSDGDYISLGYFESQDIACVMEYLDGVDFVGRVAICGRSMGSASALLYGARDDVSKKVQCFIFDGMFSSVRELASDLARQSSRLLGLISPLGIGVLKKHIRERAGFSIDDVCPIEAAAKVKLPGLFFAASKDTLFPRHHIVNVTDVYAGHHQLIDIKGGHNDFRGADFWNALNSFLHQHLKCGHDDVALFSSADVFVVQVLPFNIVDNQLRPDFKMWTQGPLQMHVNSEMVFFTSPFGEKKTIWKFPFSSFKGLDAYEGMVRIMWSATSGCMIQTPEAEKVIGALDDQIKAIIREEMERNMPALKERIKYAASVMLAQNGDDDDGAKVAKQLELALEEELGLPRKDLHDVINQAVREAKEDLHPKPLQME